MTPFDQLVQDPGFLTGISLLGGRNQDVGSTVLGIQQMAAQQQAAKQLAEQRARAQQMAEAKMAFDPSQYDTRSGLLAGGLGAGFDPSEVANMLKVLSPETERKLTVVPPGAAVLGPDGQPTFTNPYKPEVQPSAIRELDALVERVRANPNDKPAADLLGKLTGADAKAAAEERAAALAEQRQVTNDLRKQAQAQQQEQKQTQNLMKFSKELDTSGVAQAEGVLNNIEERLKKFPKGDIPGFTKTQNTVSNIGLGALLSPEAQELRQAVQTLANLTIKDRSGAAVTNPEWERFRTELGSGNFMSSDRIRQGLKQFRKLQESAKANWAAGVDDGTLNMYQERNPALRFSRPTRSNPSGITPEQAAAELARRRGLQP